MAGGARIAVSFVLNYEEGGEPRRSRATPPPRRSCTRWSAPRRPGRRNLTPSRCSSSAAAPGSGACTGLHGPRAAAHRYAVGQALERNPDAARAMIDAGWEVASHGWRWIDYGDMPEDEERDHMRRSIASIEACAARGPSAGTPVVFPSAHGGWSSKRAASLDSDSYADEFPTGSTCSSAPPGDPVHARRERLQVPAPERLRHRRRLRRLPRRLVRPASRGGRPHAVGRPALPDRRPAGRAPALDRFLEHVRGHDDAWVATRAEIARHWRAVHPAA